MKRFLLLLFLVAPFALMAQQDPIYSQYLNNPFILNPAYAGLNNAFNAAITYRKQWTGFEGSPSTVNFNSHASLVDNRVGAGVLVTEDNIGTATNTEFSVAGSYKLLLDDKTVSFGMQAGMLNFRSNYSQLNLADPADPAFATNENITKPTIGVGAILASERYMIGFSVPRMLKAQITNGGQNFNLYNQHMYLFGSYVFYLTERLRFRPSVLLRGVTGAPLATDLNLNVNIDGLYSAGIFTRNFNTYGLLLQAWLLEKLRLGYTFELPTNNSVGTQFTTHEITLGIKLALLPFHERGLSNF